MSEQEVKKEKKSCLLIQLPVIHSKNYQKRINGYENDKMSEQRERKQTQEDGNLLHSSATLIGQSASNWLTSESCYCCCCHSKSQVAHFLSLSLSAVYTCVFFVHYKLFSLKIKAKHSTWKQKKANLANFVLPFFLFDTIWALTPLPTLEFNSTSCHCDDNAVPGAACLILNYKKVLWLFFFCFSIVAFLFPLFIGLLHPVIYVHIYAHRCMRPYNIHKKYEKSKLAVNIFLFSYLYNGVLTANLGFYLVLHFAWISISILFLLFTVFFSPMKVYYLFNRFHTESYDTV